MKYKVLVNGAYNRVSDFIQHTEAFFDAISTSSCWQDILLHFKIFEPDVYLVFVEPEYEKTIGQINNFKESGYYNGAVIVLVADSATCEQIEQHARFTANLIVRRPISADNLVLKITRYFDDINEAKERAKAKAAERQAKADAEKAAYEAQVAAAVEKEVGDLAELDAPSNEKRHILIVDDDRTVLKMLKTALEDTYDVTTMVNGIMVEKFLEAKDVDVVILDYEMPVETGADIFRKIKANPKANHVPVCFLTGISEREKIMEVMALKPHGYLLKPIDMDMLFATISNLTN